MDNAVIAALLVGFLLWHKKAEAEGTVRNLKEAGESIGGALGGARDWLEDFLDLDDDDDEDAGDDE